MSFSPLRLQLSLQPLLEHPELQTMVIIPNNVQHDEH